MKELNYVVMEKIFGVSTFNEIKTCEYLYSGTFWEFFRKKIFKFFKFFQVFEVFQVFSSFSSFSSFFKFFKFFSGF